MDIGVEKGEMCEEGRKWKKEVWNTRKRERDAAEMVCVCVLRDSASDDTCGWMGVLCTAVASHAVRTEVDSRSGEAWENEMEQRRPLAPNMVIMNQRVSTPNKYGPIL